MTANGSKRFGVAYDEGMESKQWQTVWKSPDYENLTSLLEHPETSSPNQSDDSYRGRFMRGKENEYAATVETYRSMKTSSGSSHYNNIRLCRKFAMFKRDNMSGEVKVFSSACRDRWCPLCAGSKSAYAKDQTEVYIKSLKAPRFLTLTLRHNENDLKTQIEFLTMSFRTLRQRAYWKRNVTGGIWFLQVKRGKDSGLWHPHLHILLDGNYMEHERLSALWECVTFGSPIIDIRRINDVDKAASYVARYTARPAMLEGLPMVDRIEIINSLHGKRLCGTFGTGKTVVLTPPKIESDGEWTNIGYYDEVVQKAKTLDSAKAVLKAYSRDLPLTEAEFEDYTGKSVWYVCPTYEVKIDPQLYLDFYIRK